MKQAAAEEKISAEAAADEEAVAEEEGTPSRAAEPTAETGAADAGVEGEADEPGEQEGEGKVKSGYGEEAGEMTDNGETNSKTAARLPPVPVKVGYAAALRRGKMAGPPGGLPVEGRPATAQTTKTNSNTMTTTTTTTTTTMSNTTTTTTTTTPTTKTATNNDRKRQNDNTKGEEKEEKKKEGEEEEGGRREERKREKKKRAKPLDEEAEQALKEKQKLLSWKQKIRKRNRDKKLTDPTYVVEYKTWVDFGQCLHIDKKVPKAREYVDQLNSEKLNTLAFNFLQQLSQFQFRALEKDPVKARMRKRYVAGLREVYKTMKAKAVKCLFVAVNIAKSETPGGLDSILREILDLAKEKKVPVVYCLSRVKLAKGLNKGEHRVSAVLICDCSGADALLKELLIEAKRCKEHYQMYMSDELLHGGGDAREQAAKQEKQEKQTRLRLEKAETARQRRKPKKKERKAQQPLQASAPLLLTPTPYLLATPNNFAAVPSSAMTLAAAAAATTSGSLTTLRAVAPAFVPKLRASAPAFVMSSSHLPR